MEPKRLGRSRSRSRSRAPPQKPQPPVDLGVGHGRPPGRPQQEPRPGTSREHQPEGLHAESHELTVRRTPETALFERRAMRGCRGGRGCCRNGRHICQQTEVQSIGLSRTPSPEIDATPLMEPWRPVTPPALPACAPIQAEHQPEPRIQPKGYLRVGCWNCKGMGHGWTKCPSALARSCRGCGEMDFTLATCPRCRDEWRKTLAPTPALNPNSS